MSRDPEKRFPSVRAFGGALLPLASERTRVAFADELGTGAADPVGAPARRIHSNESGLSGSPAVDDTTMPPTTTYSVRSFRSRVERLLWIGLAAMATLGLVARGVVARANNRPTAAYSRSEKPAVAPQNAEGKTEANTEVTGVPSDETVQVAPGSDQAPLRPKSAAAEPKRARPTPHPTPTPSNSSSWTVGNNGAPVLPP